MHGIMECTHTCNNEKQDVCRFSPYIVACAEYVYMCVYIHICEYIYKYMWMYVFMLVCLCAL